MAFAGFEKAIDVNRGAREFAALNEAILLDVRTPEEFQEGRIPGSRNLPLQSISRAEDMLGDKDAAIFVYCHSGARSARAEIVLRSMGYSDVRNIGGIADYTGRMEY